MIGRFVVVILQSLQKYNHGYSTSTGVIPRGIKNHSIAVQLYCIPTVHGRYPTGVIPRGIKTTLVLSIPTGISFETTLSLVEPI